MNPILSTPTRTSPRPAAADLDRVRHRTVHLDVVDAGRSLVFWRDTVGLTQMAPRGGTLRLGTGDAELIVLHPGAARPALRGHTGLYHVALHLPDAPEFARVVARLAAHGVRQAPTDHIFSMATYVTDPDGINLELTLETPERFTGFEVGPRSVVVYDDAGRRRGATEPLDVAPLLALITDDPSERPLPPGTSVGHVHLHVPDLNDAVGFYRDVIGFDEHMVMSSIGMADLGAGGSFPHRLALNVWNGPRAVPPPAGTAGLRRFELEVPDRAALADVRARLESRALPHTGQPDGIEVADPAANVVRISSPT